MIAKAAAATAALLLGASASYASDTRCKEIPQRDTNVLMQFCVVMGGAISGDLLLKVTSQTDQELNVNIRDCVSEFQGYPKNVHRSRTLSFRFGNGEKGRFQYYIVHAGLTRDDMMAFLTFSDDRCDMTVTVASARQNAPNPDAMKYLNSILKAH